MDQKDFKFSKDLISINLRPQSLFENLVFIGVLLLILIFIAIFTLTQYDILINIFGLNNKMSAIVYMGVTVILLLIPFSIILNFFEKKFTRPLEVMSNKLTDYIKNGEITVDTHDSDRYSKYLSQNSEIGTLSRAILKMFSDIENYINNITSLMREKEKIEAELTVAHDIQNSFLPTDFDVGGDDVDISGIMLPAKSVGGDLYDFFMVDDDNLAFIIGDVSDKGVPAALFMSKSIQLFESYLSTRNQNFDELIYMINNALCKNNDACMFLTAWVGILNLKTGNLNYINAGHEYPIVKHCGEYEFLESENDLALGLMEDEVYTTESIDLVKGDKILLFTDGVTDANNEDNEFFGKNRLIDLASEDKSVKGIKKAVFEFIGDAEQYDDFTLLLVQFN